MDLYPKDTRPRPPKADKKDLGNFDDVERLTPRSRDLIKTWSQAASMARQAPCRWQIGSKQVHYPARDECRIRPHGLKRRIDGTIAAEAILNMPHYEAYYSSFVIVLWPDGDGKIGPQDLECGEDKPTVTCGMRIPLAVMVEKVKPGAGSDGPEVTGRLFAPCKEPFQNWATRYLNQPMASDVITFRLPVPTVEVDARGWFESTVDECEIKFRCKMRAYAYLNDTSQKGQEMTMILMNIARIHEAVRAHKLMFTLIDIESGLKAYHRAPKHDKGKKQAIVGEKLKQYSELRDLLLAQLN